MKPENIILSNKERLNFVRNLGVMLGAGIPILKALDSLHREAKGNIKIVLETLQKDVNQGKKVSESLDKFPKAFDSITTSLIKAAEESGNLDSVLKDVSDDIKNDMEFNDKLRSAMVYPIFVFTLFVVIFLLILTYAIPRISQVFTKLDVVIPWPTKVLMFMSETLINNYIGISIGVVILLLIIFLFYKSKRNYFIYTLFSLPILSTLANEIDISRITKSLGILLKSGIPITKALELTQQIAYRKPMVLALDQANKDVTEGKSLGSSFQKFPKIFPDMVIKFIEAGEQSGNLEQSMNELSTHYDDEVANTLKRITNLMEPIMLVIIGIFIGGIMLSIIAPIYQLIGNISAR